MIKTRIYTVNQKESTYTDLIESTIVTDSEIVPYMGDLMYPYYMGYVLDEDMPLCAMANEITMQDGYLIVNKLHQNHSWGFCTVSRSALNDLIKMAFIYADSNGDFHIEAPFSTTPEIRFLNKIEMCKLNSQKIFRIGIRYVIVRTQDLGNNDTFIDTTSNAKLNINNVFTESKDTDLLSWQDFILGNVTISTLTRSYGATNSTDYPRVNSKTFYIDYDGFDETGTFRTTFGPEGNEDFYTLFLQISTIRPYLVSRYGDTLHNEYVGVSPFFEYETPECPQEGIPAQRAMILPFRDEHTEVTIRFVAATQNEAGYFVQIDKGTGTNDTWFGNVKFLNINIPNNLTYEDSGLSLVRDLSISYAGILRGNTIVKKNTHSTSTGVDSADFYGCSHPDDVLKILAFFHKIDTQATGYSDIEISTTYTPRFSTSLFDENDVPLYERKQEALSNILSELRPWQIPGNDITDDEFDFINMPEYIPDEKEDEDRMSGVDWLLNNTFPYGSTAGFVTPYVLTGKQIEEFSGVLWATFNDPDFWKAIGTVLSTSLSLNPADILDYIVSLRAYPMAIPGDDETSGDIYFGRGFVPIHVRGTIKRLGVYNFSVNSGWALVPETFGDFRDYEPCTRVSVYLPFCGIIELTPSQVVGNELRLTYSIDLSNGACVAAIEVRGNKQYVICTAEGNIGAQVQMSASNLGQIMQKGVGAVQAAATGAALLMVGTDLAAGTAEAELASAKSTAEMSEIMTRYGETQKALTEQANVSAARSIGSMSNIHNVPYARFGQSSGFSNFLNITPMIRIETRYYDIPDNYAHVYGYACNKTVTLKDLEGKGFTVCSNIDLSGVPATVEELSAIETLLQSGVYL